ncbi:MAG: hypothetical protein Q9208_003316 [Pyrenodesmia sp. 3 TL-2023]
MGPKPVKPPTSPPTTRRSKRLREQAITTGEETEVPAAKRAKGDAPVVDKGGGGVKKGKKKQPKKEVKSKGKGKETVKADSSKETAGVGEVAVDEPETKASEVEKAAVKKKEKEGPETATSTTTTTKTAKKPKKTKKPSPINTGTGTGGAAGLPSPYAVAPSIPLSIPQTDTSTAALATAFAVHSALPRPPTTAWRPGHAFASWYRHAPLSEAAAADTYTQQGKIATIPAVQAAWIGAYGQIVWEDAVSTARAMKGPGKANVPQMRRAVEVRRTGDADGEDVAFELVWRKVGGGAVMRVNGREFGGERSGGEVTVSALPDYAIVEIEDVVIFWFGKEEALDFVPEQKQKTGVSDEEILGETEPSALSEGEKPAAAAAAVDPNIGLNQKALRQRRQAWKKILEDGMDLNTANNIDAIFSDPEDAHQIESQSGLSNEDITLAIACLWESRRKSHERYFAFNDFFQYQLARGSMTNADGSRATLLAAVHAPHDLLIPLVLHDEHASPPNSAKYEPGKDPTRKAVAKTAEEKEKEKKKEDEGDKGHIVFVAARNEPNNTVSTFIMDSFEGRVEAARIQRSAERTVEEIGWKAMNPDGTAPKLLTNPTFIHNDVAVPHQEGINTCGMYTIFNAWVYMLQLPAPNRRERYYPDGGRPTLEARAFLADGLEMINLALRGHMDYRTIQAFFNCYGYCQLQDPDDAGVALSGSSKTDLMTGKMLGKLLEERRDVETIQLSDVHEVMEMTSCSREEAQENLELMGGDVRAATNMYLERRTSS